MSGRCKACDSKLSDSESLRKIKSTITGKIDYLELCYGCSNGTNYDDTIKIHGKETPLLEIEDEN